MKRIIFLLILLLIIPKVNVKALNCQFSEIARLKKIASNVNISYDYVEKNNSVVFKVNLINLHKDLYFVDETDNKIYNYSKNELTLSKYKSGQTVKYTFYSTNPDCPDPLVTLRVVLPTYNEFYKDPVCVGAETYSLCQKWSSHGLSYDEFVSKVTKYKETLNEEQTDDKTEKVEQNSFINVLISLLTDYYIFIIIFFMILTISVIVYKRRNDNIYS